METYKELKEKVNNDFDCEFIVARRGSEIMIAIQEDDFDEDYFHDLLENWDGEYFEASDNEAFEDYEGCVVVKTGLCVDSDGESLILFEEDEFLDKENEEDWDGSDAWGSDDTDDIF